MTFKNNITLESIARIPLGIGLLFFGLNGFFQWMIPPSGPEAEVKLLIALNESGYIFPIVYSILIVTSISFLSNKFMNTGLLLIAPVLVNIVLIHMFLGPKGIVPGGVLFILMLLLFYARKTAFINLIKK